jgi:hypothetical protein
MEWLDPTGFMGRSAVNEIQVYTSITLVSNDNNITIVDLEMHHGYDPPTFFALSLPLLSSLSSSQLPRGTSRVGEFTGTKMAQYRAITGELP